ncbi:hypothetical protein CL622_08705 [archaeon]|nr:hypothetical protein [archaeon]|tara:strand:- start:537 stop:812 length:276 start_codon:yes stop_codon:yes gene_type:complete
MKFESKEEIKATILYHLRRKKVIGGKHSHFDTLKKGFPSHLKKEVDKVAKQLVKEGFLITKPAGYGLQVFLNKQRLQEIEAFIHKVMGFKF